MASLKIRRDVMEKARSRANLTAAEREAIAPLFEQNNGKGAQRFRRKHH